MLKFFYITITFVFLSFVAKAQELYCNVNIDNSNVQLTAADKTLVEDLKIQIANFMNNRKWTNDVMNPEERIKCNIFITIKEVPAFGSFVATASIQASRPVFESMYESTLINFFDKRFNFTFRPSEPLDFNENTYFSNLTSMLGFYAYIIIGMDYDSFSKLGGTPHFEKARNIANIAQNEEEGWTAKESTNNRYWLIENLNNQQIMPLREGMYTYHRVALDNFIKDPENSRKEIFEMLKTIKQVTQFNPYSILVKTFFLTKLNELVKIFSEANPQMRPNVVELLQQLDPMNSEKYAQITNRR
jgi:hypothetical protein